MTTGPISRIRLSSALVRRTPKRHPQGRRLIWRSRGEDLMNSFLSSGPENGTRS